MNRFKQALAAPLRLFAVYGARATALLAFVAIAVLSYIAVRDEGATNGVGLRAWYEYVAMLASVMVIGFFAGREHRR